MVGWRNFVFLSALCYQYYIFAHGGDTLMRGQSIQDEVRLGRGGLSREAQSLVSANGNFELGFFSPGNSSKRYIGIWYKKVKEPTVVWVANRGKPLKDYKGSLMIDRDGRLMIMQYPGGIHTQYSSVIHTIVSSSTASTENSCVRLKLWDSGNLELTEGEKPDRRGGRLLWQSFDYPSDTYLPGMKLGLSKIGENTKMLTSWRDKDDPRLGSFKLKLDPSGGASSHLYVWKDMEPMYWMSGFWNGQVFSWIPETGKYNFSFKFDDGGSYFDYSFSDASVFSRLVIDVSGKLKLFTWSEKAQKWSLLWFHPRGFCDVYNPCGPNSICDDHASPHCKCLRGFEPSSPREWSSNLGWSGCKRQMPLSCGATDEFMLLKKMRLPAPSEDFRISELRHKDCQTMCQKSCSCKAYAFADRNGSQCYHWGSKHDRLFGIQENNSNGQDLYVRRSDFQPNRTKRQLWIMAPVMVPSILVMGAFIFYLGRRALIKRRRGPRHKAKRETSEEVSFFNLADTPLGGNNGLVFQVFSFATVSAATNNFSIANKLGEGGFGPVYKGKLRKGQQIAVKRLSGRSNQGLEEFRNEILLIAKLQHINLVRLLGYCVEGEEKILVYEYMPNKSLDSFLFDQAKQKLLDWRKRIQIINGITQGLLYLHRYSRLRIIHRDLKASNILLDSEMNPKISDFGLARIFGQDESEAKTNRIVGTLGYMSPEYAVGGLFSEKSDVFSFGVLLLEIISGKKNTSIHLFEESLNLLGYAWELWKNGRSLDLIDPILRDSSPECEVTRCIHLGLLCVQESAKDRPAMSHVAALLNDENTPLPTPTRPAFTLGRDLTMTAAQGTCSVNQLTLSVMEAR